MYPYQHVNIFSLNYLTRVNIISLTLSACCVFIIKGDSSLHNTHLQTTENNPIEMESNDNKQLDRISYALGLSMGNNFRASGINEINVQDFADGVAAVFLGSQPKMTYDEAKAEIQAYFTELEKKQRAAAEETGRKNREAGEAFLAENGKRAEVKTTASGLQYEVLTEGNGPMPQATDQVEVHYTGKLIDGTVFDSSVDRGIPATFGVTQVIPGWVEALQLMKAGSKWRLFIPSALAYGPNGAPGSPIGPDSTLIFDVELLKVIGK